MNYHDWSVSSTGYLFKSMIGFFFYLLICLEKTSKDSPLDWIGVIDS